MELLNMHVLPSYKLQDANIELVLTFFILGLWVVYDMGDSGNNKSSHKMSRTEMESFSLDASRFSRDFLTRFMGSSSSNSTSGGSREAKKFGHYDDDNDDDDDELNLGLSLGGRFGVDKSSKNNKLIRSSSIAACLPVVRDDNDAVSASASPAQPVAFSSLVRTSSLPVETEEEWRKRKELQTLRRMEAKRRRSEKQRKAEREGLVCSTTAGEEEKKDATAANLRRDQQCLAAAKRFSSSVTAPPAPAAARQSIVGGGIDAAMSKGKGNILGTNLLGQLLLSQGSVESQGGSFSSELESTKSLQGSTSCSDLSPGSIQSSQKGNEQDVGSSSTKTKEESGRTTSLSEVENPSKKKPDATNKGKESKKNTLEEMPCVFTKGDGPNGRRVDGILYKYGKGEEVRIMCVCHGNFLSPAEFIKHAGGTDVAHPLKHIVVNPNASPFP